MQRLGAILAALGLMVPAVAAPAGFSIYEQGGRALGSAGAMTARVGDASAIFFNPAGLVRVEGGELYAGTSWIYVTREFTGANPYPGFGATAESPKHSFFPSHLYWAQSLSPGLAVGFGIYNPFGLTTEWEDPASFPGRFLSTKATLTPFFFNPAFAFSFSPGFRVGLGVTAVHSSLELNRNVPQVNPLDEDPKVLDLGTVTLEGDNGLDFGFNFGIQLEVNEHLTLAGSYRSGIDVPFDGTADFTFEGTGTRLDPQLALLFPEDQAVETEISFPASLVLAVAVQAAPRLSIEADLGWTQWSSFDRLPLNFEDEARNSAIVVAWDDAFFYRFGGEYALNRTTDLRFGYYFDETPQPTQALSPLLPDNDRHGVSLGVGKDWGTWRADLFGLFLFIPDRETDGINRDAFEGTYANGVQILGASLGFRY